MGEALTLLPTTPQAGSGMETLQLFMEAETSFSFVS